MKVCFVLKTGEERVIEGNVGESLLDAMNRNNVPIFGMCGGAGVCGSCRVRLDPSCVGVGAPEESEMDVLEVFQTEPCDGMRLACQIFLNESNDGLRVFLL
jgi:ferredoxin